MNSLYEIIQNDLEQSLDEIRISNEESPLNEMAAIGDMSSKYQVWIRNNDPGKIPHFHILDTKTLGCEFNCAVSLR